MKNLNTVMISMILLGCGGGSFTSADKIDNAGSSNIGEAGENSVAGNVGTNSAGSANGGNAGVENIAGNSSVGGNINSSGAGGIAGNVNSAGNGGTAGDIGTAGNSGVGGSGAVLCYPITCDSYSIAKTGTTGMACGSIDDGCGKMINCTGDKTQGNAICADFYQCGGDAIRFTKAQVFAGDIENVPGISNICGGGCSSIIAAGNSTCGMLEMTSKPVKLLCNYILSSYTTNDLPIGVNCTASQGSTYCCASLN